MTIPTVIYQKIAITFTLNGSCPYFYFTNMLKQEIVFENYYDFYTHDTIEQVSLALAEPVPPDDYEMQVTVTVGGSVLQRRDILVYVRGILLLSKHTCMLLCMMNE